MVAKGGVGRIGVVYSGGVDFVRCRLRCRPRLVAIAIDLMKDIIEAGD